MKTTFLKNYLTHVQENLKGLVVRFPLQIVVIALMATLFFMLNHIGYDSELQTPLMKGVLSCIVTFFLSLGFAITAESKSLNYMKAAGLKVLAVLCGLGFYYLLSDLGSGSDAVLAVSTIAGAIAYVFFAPYLEKKTEKDQYYGYFYNTSVAFVFAIIVGVLLLILGMIALQTINLLFDVLQGDNIYGDWAIIALSIFAPLCGLTYIPFKASFTTKKYNIAAFVEFIIKYIGISFVCIYFIILYAYSIKVLMNFNEWPQGEVSWLVIGFSIGGYLVYAYSSPLEENNTLIATFRKFLPYVILPQLLMLFYAIYLRINQYGLTINRYLVVIFGVFLVIVSCYYIVSRIKSLKILPMTLAIAIVAMSLGPRSIYNLPVADQLERLETKLVETNILQDGVIVAVPKDMPIAQESGYQILDMVRYLCEYHKCDAMKELFPTIDYAETNRYTTQEKIGALINLSYIGGDYNRRYTLQGKDFLANMPLDVSGFSALVSVNTMHTVSGLRAIVNAKDQKLTVMSGSNELESMDISHVFQKIIALDAQPGTWKEYDKELQFDLQPAGHRLVIAYIDFTLKGENDNMTIDPFGLQLNGYLLMK